MLLIGDYQTQILKMGGIGKQRVGADGQVDLSCLNGFPGLYLCLGLHGAGEQAYPEPHRLQQMGL